LPSDNLSALILAWYDRHARALPWRIPPGSRARPDPYHIWLSEVMLQQTTVAAVRDYFRTFTTRWPTVEALSSAPLDEVLAAWAGLGYYARARNLHHCAVAIAEAGGRFPETEAGLRALPGIGPYTAAAVAAIAFGKRAAVLDGNVERVMARLHAETDPLPGVKERLRAHATALTPGDRPGDYAQAVMDLGATVCTPRKPACGICPWRAPCRARAQGIAETLPAKTPKAERTVRFGAAYVALDAEGRMLTERRPPSGLLGGMLALPSTPWAETPPEPAPPFDANWRLAGEVRHTFTHFHLRLTVWRVQLPRLPGPALQADEAEAAMPTVFAKATRLGRGGASAPAGGSRPGRAAGRRGASG
jgi:A/G-specific adenine glycosylase